MYGEGKKGFDQNAREDTCYQREGARTTGTGAGLIGGGNLGADVSLAVDQGRSFNGSAKQRFLKSTGTPAP